MLNCRQPAGFHGGRRDQRPAIAAEEPNVMYGGEHRISQGHQVMIFAATDRARSIQYGLKDVTSRGPA